MIFYEKLSDALIAGFHIIPNFGGDVFAIRTERNASGSATSTYGPSNALRQVPTQNAQALPAGDGEYQSNVPMAHAYAVGTEGAPGKEVTRYNAYVTGFAEIDFPFSLARPEVLTATQQAMALKIFDGIGSATGDSQGRPDGRRADQKAVDEVVAREQPPYRTFVSRNQTTRKVTVPVARADDAVGCHHSSTTSRRSPQLWRSVVPASRESSLADNLGADTMAQVWAVEHFRPFTAYPARPKRWETFTEAAHRRNQQIVDESDSLIAFPCQHSKGTWDTIRRAKKKGIPVEVIIIGKSPRGDFDHCSTRAFNSPA